MGTFRQKMLVSCCLIASGMTNFPASADASDVQSIVQRVMSRHAGNESSPSQSSQQESGAKASGSAYVVGGHLLDRKAPVETESSLSIPPDFRGLEITEDKSIVPVLVKNRLKYKTYTGYRVLYDPRKTQLYSEWMSTMIGAGWKIEEQKAEPPKEGLAWGMMIVFSRE